jgi:hypothetical protein
LAGHFTVRVMDGSVAMAEREQIMRDFRAGAFEVLLLSQVGAEGLDFEFCNVLVNYDMPWNPMEVEQRIGRLDRFGQTHEKIFIYNMRVPGTIETDIFGRLYDRIDLFHNSIGSLEPILRDADVVHGLLDPRLSPSERDAQIERLAVAAEARAQDLARLEQSRGVLAGIDSLLIDGLTADSVPQGRYIGPTEIATILGELLRRTDASMTTVDGHLELRGSRRLASLLTESPVRDGGSRHDRSRLAALLRDESPLPVTLSPAQASASDSTALLAPSTGTPGAARADRGVAGAAAVRRGLAAWAAARPSLPGHRRPRRHHRPATAAGAVGDRGGRLYRWAVAFRGRGAVGRPGRRHSHRRGSVVAGGSRVVVGARRHRRLVAPRGHGGPPGGRQRGPGGRTHPGPAALDRPQARPGRGAAVGLRPRRAPPHRGPRPYPAPPPGRRTVHTGATAASP